MSATRNRFSHRYRKAAAGATVAVAAAALLAGCGSSQSTATTATPAAATASAGAPSGAQGTPSALGKVVTGAAADKAEAAALARYPGTVERVMQLSDGSYVVHVIRSSGGEVHVKVSKTFAVAGTEQGTPGGGPPPSSGTTTS
jgi:uncharacterized lipoprotein YajG